MHSHRSLSLTRPVCVVNIEMIWPKQAVSTFVYTKMRDAESRHAAAYVLQ